MRILPFDPHGRNRADAAVVLKDVLPLVAGTEMMQILVEMGLAPLAAGTELMQILVETLLVLIPSPP